VSDQLVAALDDQAAGVVTHLGNGRLRFEYDDAYRVLSAATPLSVAMPTTVRAHSDRVITPWLGGLLPEDPEVVASWARRFHVSRAPFALLGTQIGMDCAGAFRFLDASRADQALGQRGRVEWLSERDIAALLRDLVQDTTSWLGRTFTGQFSLAGAQAKRALLYRNGRWGSPTGAIPTSHILKPAIRGFRDHELNEHLCLDAAGRAGLLVARTRVQRFGDQSAIVVERFDRRIVDGQLRRVHQEDVCQALAKRPAQKYQQHGGPSPREIAQLLRRVMPPSAAADAVARFVDALIWNWIVGGTDAHAKNYSLLLSADQVRLAPLYDIASALPYRHERDLRLAMRLGADYRMRPQRDPWPAVARELRVDAEATVERVRALLNSAPDAFSDAAKARDVVALRRPLPDRLVDLVASRSTSCLRLIGG
jgi:serine/threonine-protein kinase HipA